PRARYPPSLHDALPIYPEPPIRQPQNLPRALGSPVPVGTEDLGPECPGPLLILLVRAAAPRQGVQLLPGRQYLLAALGGLLERLDRTSTRLNSSHVKTS